MRHHSTELFWVQCLEWNPKISVNLLSFLYWPGETGTSHGTPNPVGCAETCSGLLEKTGIYVKLTYSEVLGAWCTSAKKHFCLFEVCCLLPFSPWWKLETVPLSNRAGFTFFFWNLLTGQGPFGVDSLGITAIAKEALNYFFFSAWKNSHEYLPPPRETWASANHTLAKDDEESSEKAHKALTNPSVGAGPRNFTSQWAVQTWL